MVKYLPKIQVNGGISRRVEVEAPGPREAIQAALPLIEGAGPDDRVSVEVDGVVFSCFGDELPTAGDAVGPDAPDVVDDRCRYDEEAGGLSGSYARGGQDDSDVLPPPGWMPSMPPVVVRNNVPYIDVLEVGRPGWAARLRERLDRACGVPRDLLHGAPRPGLCPVTGKPHRWGYLSPAGNPDLYRSCADCDFIEDEPIVRGPRTGYRSRQRFTWERRPIGLEADEMRWRCSCGHEGILYLHGDRLVVGMRCPVCKAHGTLGP